MATRRLPDDPESPEFWAAYADAMQLPTPRASPNAVSALIAAWTSSPEWAALAASTREDWTRYLGRIDAAWGRLEVRGIEPHHVLALRDTYRDAPAAANNLIRCLSSMLAWSVPRAWRRDNPCREIPMLAGGDGYPPWDWPTITAARATLRADLWRVVALALYTGQRQGDVLAMRWDAMRDGRVHVRQEKTGKRLAIPIHRDLASIIADAPRSAVTILVNSRGRPWTRDGFKATWNKMRPAGAPAFHGLRKSAVVMLLEAGCSDAEVRSITGQSQEMIEHYARMVNQGRLASAAMQKWEAATWPAQLETRLETKRPKIS
jgi:integrase